MQILLAESSRVVSDFFCELTLKDGEVVWDWNGRAARNYKQLGDTYGIREGEFLVLPPDS